MERVLEAMCDYTKLTRENQIWNEIGRPIGGLIGNRIGDQIWEQILVTLTTEEN